MKKTVLISLLLTAVLSFCNVQAEGTPLTRLEFCRIANNLFTQLKDDASNIPEECQNPFDDTDDDAVLRLYSLGVLKGVSEDKFAPNETLTREQACVIFAKVISSAVPQSNLNMHKTYHFDDDSYISYWAKNYIDYMYHHKIILGTADYTISPQLPVTRDEALAMADRILNSAGGFAYAATDANQTDASGNTEKHSYKLDWLVEPKYQGGIGSTKFSGGL
ncbi:MAG: S-layer homology domain-containing protein, partial [Monoglobaceae bacterium]